MTPDIGFKCGKDWLGHWWSQVPPPKGFYVCCRRCGTLMPGQDLGISDEKSVLAACDELLDYVMEARSVAR